MTKLSAIIKGSICLLGLVGVGNILIAPANAEAAARGAITLVRASGASVSVSGELTLPNNAYFTGALQVGASYGDTTSFTSASDNEQLSSVTITPGGINNSNLVGANNPFLQAAADALTAASGDIGAQAAIIRAGAGVNGLGGLE
ncbi:MULTISPECIES: hypothetical protein [unclassified Anabaena]|uniref:hypothetical protein n=1 Tax=unclassified Anabaena TaxID=2619674 RepID=UPI0039C7087F